MATCKENCIHYPVCGIWDRKVFVDYNKDILSDFSDLPNVEEYCRNYLSKKSEARWKREEIYDGYDAYSYEVKYTCSNCLEKQKVNTRYCPVCGAKMGGAI